MKKRTTLLPLARTTHSQGTRPTSHAPQAQGEAGSSSSSDVDTDWIGCNEVFGGSGRGVRWDWFFPTKVVFLGDSKPLVLGYVVDEGRREVDEEEGMEMKDIKEEEVRCL